MSTAEPTRETPLDLRDLFSSPWSGTATIWRPWWLRWIPTTSVVRFRTEISDAHLAETTGLVVHDTQTLANGKIWTRTMTARLVGPGHWRIEADDMPGGADQIVTATGFTFSYTIVAPVLGPIRLPLRCEDEVVLVNPTTLHDTVQFRFLGIHVGTMEMTLGRE